MNPLPAFVRGRSRAGISLLEVLISIGVLSIGLLATMALIPAGRTYMHKAAIDDRAAAMIPAAFETIATQKLLGASTLSWAPVSDPGLANVEGSSAVIRTQGGEPSKVNPATGYTTPAGWTIEGIDTETITAFYAKNMPPAAITGAVAVEAPPQSRTVTVSSSPSAGPNGSTSSNATSGNWSFDLPVRPLPAPDMTIATSGGQAGTVTNQPYTDYTFTANYVDNTGRTQSAGPNPASFRQHGRWRQVDRRTGKATTIYGAPSNATTINQNAGSATAVSMSTLETVQPAIGRGMIPRTVTKTISDRLWRWWTGTVRNSYEQDVDFANVDNAPPQPRTGVFNDQDITINAGAFVGGASTIEDAEDWYSMGVLGGDIIRVRNNSSWLKPEPVSTKSLPIWFNSTSTLMQPEPMLSDATSDFYFFPVDGTLLTRAALDDASTNTLDGNPGTALVPPRDNPIYSFLFERIPSERVIVVDPLMATRLDKVMSNDGNGPSSSYYLRRHRFADFQQIYAGDGTIRQRRIPRLNWYPLTQGSNVDTAVAIAEYLFREQDALVTDTSGDPEAAPGPVFDLTAVPAPVRRQTAGRMSWLTMLQPLDPGPAALNWSAGKYFNVSLIVFEDRSLPALTSPAFSGEYAFEATWSDVDGLLAVQVPATFGGEDIEEEDVRRLFRTGGWILLAPKVIPATNPLADTTQLKWHRIQSCRLQKQASGETTAQILLETEPAADTLNAGLRSTPNVSNLVVLAYGGVIAVVNRQMQVEP
jgi:hypothetical protein